MARLHSFLQVSDLSMRFGGLLAVDGVALECERARNFRHHRPQRGGQNHRVQLHQRFLHAPPRAASRCRARSIAGLGSHAVARKGVVRTFQNVRLFKRMTVLENLLVAQHQKARVNVLAGLFNTASFRRQEAEAIERSPALAGLHGTARICQPRGGQPGLWPPAPAGNCTLHDHRAQGADAR